MDKPSLLQPPLPFKQKPLHLCFFGVILTSDPFQLAREDHPFVVSFGSFWFCSRWRWSLSQLLLCVYKKGRLAFVDRESQELKPPFHRLQWQKHPHVPPEPGFNSVLENSLWDFLNPEQSWHSFFSTSGFKCFSFFQPFIISVLTF